MRYFAALALAASMLTGCDDGAFDNEEFEGITPLTSIKVILLFGETYAEAKGVWTIVDDNVASRYNLSEYLCHRDKMICNRVWADLTDWGNSNTFDVGQEILSIDTWTETEIVMNSSDGCRDARTVISKKEGTVTQTLTNNLERYTCMKDEQGKPYQSVLKKPRHLRMITAMEFKELD